MKLLTWFALGLSWHTGIASAASDGFFQWSNTELQYLHGDGYREPFNPHDIGMSIITFTHADGWAYGHNFMFMDTLFSESGQEGQIAVYGEAYSYLSLGKLLKRNLSWLLFKDLSAAIAVNAGENFDSRSSGVRAVLYGFSVDLNLPGFQFFSIDFLRQNVIEPQSQPTSWQITPVWNLPFEFLGCKWSLEGFADFVGAKGGSAAATILAQPQLRLDVGDLWQQSRHLYLGIEYQYWHNKYGIEGLEDSVPQALLLWKF